MDDVTPNTPYLRIGALAERAEVSPELLRAWERRYGLLRPKRTEGGFRLYSAADVERVAAMKRHLDEGVPASEAARLAINDAAPVSHEPLADPGVPLLTERTDALYDALMGMDEAAAHAAFDDLLADFRLETVVAHAVLPVLRRVGEDWVAGTIDVAQEHFASSILRGRLLGLARGWGAGSGPTVVLACLPGEMHDLGLICLGIIASRRGFAITHLGQDTPVSTIRGVAVAREAAATVVLGMDPARFDAVRADLGELALVAPTWIAGAGATPELADALGCSILTDPADGALELASAVGQHV